MSDPKKSTKVVVVYHSSSGCETGCCGHVVRLPDGREYFEFGHPHGDDLDWENCVISDD